jgi:hypothetical protein
LGRVNSCLPIPQGSKKQDWAILVLFPLKSKQKGKARVGKQGRAIFIWLRGMLQWIRAYELSKKQEEH